MRHFSNRVYRFVTLTVYLSAMIKNTIKVTRPNTDRRSSDLQRCIYMRYDCCYKVENITFDVLDFAMVL